MAGLTRLELATSDVTGQRSNQLSYSPLNDGGHNRARTCDPLLVRQVLSQLSYAPLIRKEIITQILYIFNFDLSLLSMFKYNYFHF